MKKLSLPAALLRGAACLALLAFALPGAVFAADHGGHTDRAWGEVNGPGEYSNGTKFYLSNDVTVEGALKFSNSGTTFCLAGNTLLLRNGNSGGRDLQVNAPLVIEDCVGGGSIEASDAEITVGKNGALTLRGVRITAPVTVYDTLNVEDGSTVWGNVTVKDGATVNVSGTSTVNLTVEAGGTVNIAEGATVSGSITLNGGSLEANNATLSCKLTVNSTSTANLTGTTVTGNGNTVTVNDGTCTITGGRIEKINNNSGNGGGVCVGGGTCNITEGGVTITGNTAENGGGIYVGGGTLIVNGATEISNNTANTNGGGLYAAANGDWAFNVSTEITENKAEYGSGGGVYLAGPAAGSGLYSMNGAAITGNTAWNDGGGVYVGENAKFMCLKGSADISRAISENTATHGNGGGVYVADGAELTVGADIMGNTAGGVGGGIYGIGNCTVNVNGSVIEEDYPVIYSNTDSTGENGIRMDPNLDVGSTTQWTVNLKEGYLNDKSVFYGVTDEERGKLNITRMTNDGVGIVDAEIHSVDITINGGSIKPDNDFLMTDSTCEINGGYCRITKFKTSDNSKVWVEGGYFDADPSSQGMVIISVQNVVLLIDQNTGDPDFDKNFPYAVYDEKKDVSGAQNGTPVYDGSPVEAGVDFILSNADGATVNYSYKAQDAGDDTYTPGWPTAAGAYTIRAKCLNAVGKWYAETSFGLTISKADPQPEPVTGLQGLHGHALAEVALPEGWAWKDGTAAMNAAGEQSFTAVFTPTDTANYNTVDVALTVNVEHDWGDWVSNGDGTHAGACLWAGCGEQVQENCSGGTPGYFTKPVCAHCGGEYGGLVQDTTAPTGVISTRTNQWNTLLEKITFDLFFKETQTVTITAHDDSYDEPGYTSDKAAAVGWAIYRGDTPPTTVPALEAQNFTFTNYTGPFNIQPDDRLVVYAKITDHAGNITYISSDGLVLDGTAPAVTGVENGGVYYVTRQVTAADENLDKVLLDGVQMQSPFTLAGNVEKTCVITAADKAGNVTTVTVSMKPIAALEEAVKDVTADTVAFENEADLRAALTAAKGVDITCATQAEQEELNALAARLEGLLTVLTEAKAADQTVAALPEAVEPDDAEAEGDILAAKAQFDALTAHQQQLIPEAAKKLEKLLADLKNYRLVQGDGSSWYKGGGDMTFTANGPLKKLAGVLVDGKAVDAANYTAASGSTILTFKQAFLETLTVGAHTLTVQYPDGAATGSFEVLAARPWTPGPTATPVPAATASGVPATGEDGPLMWVGLLVFSAAGLAAVWGFGRRSGKK